ncbi:iron reductase domain protein [Hyaloscypha variabilis]
MKLTLLSSVLALSSTSLAATSTGIIVEPKTNISFSSFSDSASGYTFGIALPTTPGTDFIGYLAGKGVGWSGVSLGGPMTNKLLVVAWPNSKATSIVGSFREVAKYGPPPEVTGTFTQTAIPAGTYTDGKIWSYVFLCSKCIASDGTTFAATDATGALGWAVNAAAPATPDKSSSSLSKHTSQGKISLDLKAAQSANYATWAALATKSSRIVRK